MRESGNYIVTLLCIIYFDPQGYSIRHPIQLLITIHRQSQRDVANKKQVNVAYAQSEKSNPKYKKLKSTGDVIAECIISPSLLSRVGAHTMRDYAGCRSCKNNTKKTEACSWRFPFGCVIIIHSRQIEKVAEARIANCQLPMANWRS